MGRRLDTQPERGRDPRRGETWRDVWAREHPSGPTAATRVTRGTATKPPQPDGTTPLERDDRPINQSR
jgi:hypothetical protein